MLLKKAGTSKNKARELVLFIVPALEWLGPQAISTQAASDIGPTDKNLAVHQRHPPAAHLFGRL